MKNILILFFFLATSSCDRAQKTGYININQVYKEIEMTSSYNAHLSMIENVFAKKISEERSQKNQLKDLILAKPQPSQQELKTALALSNQMDSIENFFSQAFKDSTDRYHLLVEKKVNRLVYQFGKTNGYQYLYSPANSNSFMYADSSLDVSKEVVAFINSHTKETKESKR